VSAPPAGRLAVAVVPATPDHAAAIRALPDLGASTRRLLDHDLVAEGRCALVALDPGGEVIGFAAGLLQVDEGHVLDLAVVPGRRRHGVGRRLLEELSARLTRSGAVGVTLEVRRSNVAALALYRRLGFVVEGERPRYYPDGEDALLMWKRD
jgi:[ribosomal protein S18]-alanine N-acetyltransferase